VSSCFWIGMEGFEGRSSKASSGRFARPGDGLPAQGSAAEWLRGAKRKQPAGESEHPTLFAKNKEHPLGALCFCVGMEGFEGRSSKASSGRFARPGERRRMVARRKAQTTRRRSEESHSLRQKQRAPIGCSLFLCRNGGIRRAE